MFQDIDLRELSQLQGPERAFVSLYLADPDGLNSLKRREQRIRDLLADDPAELEHFDESMKLIRQTLDENPGPEHGLCLFACWAQDYCKGFKLSVSTSDMLRVGPGPYIRPLAELQDEYEDFLIVAADNDDTHIWHVSSAVVREEGTVRGDIKNHVKKGGWSQKRYQRRRQNELLHYAKDIDERLSEIVQREGVERIVLLGSSETLQELDEHLSEPVRQRVVGQRAVDLHDPQDELVEEAFELYWQEERQSEEQLWDRIRNEGLGEGLAAMGPDEVLQAAMLGRVEKMIVTRDVKIRGTRCRDCENITTEEVDRCPTCGSESIFGEDLIDELARQLELTGAEADFVDELPGLTRVGHVAALLRY